MKMVLDQARARTAIHSFQYIFESANTVTVIFIYILHTTIYIFINVFKIYKSNYIK